MDTACTPDIDSSGQQPRRFLKRGEGVQKRVFGPQIRKARGSSLTPSLSPGVDPEGSGAWPSDVQHGTHYDQSTPAASRWQAAYEHVEQDEQLDTPSSELQGSTTLVLDTTGMPPLISNNSRTTSKSHTASRPRMGVLAALNGGGAEQPGTAANRDDLELAEFEALEQQIRKDLGHGMQRDAPLPSTGWPTLSRQPMGKAAAVQATTQQAESLGQRMQQTASLLPSRRQLDAGPGLAAYGNNFDNLSAMGFNTHRAADPSNSFTAAASSSDGQQQQQTRQTNAAQSGMFAASQPLNSQNEQAPAPQVHPANLGGAALAALGFDDDMEQWDAESAAVQVPVQPASKPHKHGLSAWQGEEQHDITPAGQWGASDEQWNHAQNSGQDPNAQDSSSPALAQPFVRSLFAGNNQGSAGGKKGQGGAGSAKRGAGGRVGDDGIGVELAAAQQRIAHLEQENTKLVQERTSLAKLRTEMERAMLKLEADKQAAERKQATDASAFETWRAAEVARLERDRRVLDKQSKALLKLPNKKERSAVEALEAVLEEHQREARATAARHKLQLERLRRQLLEQQEKNRELREEVRWHEARQLGLHAGSSAPKPAVANAAVQADLGGATLQAAVLHAAAEQLLPHLQPTRKVTSTTASQSSKANGSWPAARMGAHRQSGDVSEQSGSIDGQEDLHTENLEQQGAALSHDYQGAQRRQVGQGHQRAIPVSGGGRGQQAGYSQPQKTIRDSPVERNPASGGYSSGQEAAALQEVGNTLRLLRVEREQQEQHVQGTISNGSARRAASSRSAQATTSYMEAPQDGLSDHEQEASFGSHTRSQDAVQSYEQSWDDQHHLQPSWDDDRHTYHATDHHSHHTSDNTRADHGHHSKDQAISRPDRVQRSHSGHPSATQATSGSSAAAKERASGRTADTAASAPAPVLATMAAASSGTPSIAHQRRHHDRHAQQQAGSHQHDAHESHSGQSKPQHGMQQGSKGAATRKSSSTCSAATSNGAASKEVHLGADREAPEREVQHPDGKRELFYASGRRDVCFSNGTMKVVLPNGGLTVISFNNGDIKHHLSDGTTQYFYAEVGTWHTTYAADTKLAGVEVFHFPTGQAEAHHPGGYKEVLFADGLARRVWPDGREQDVPRQLLSDAATQPCPRSMMQQLGLLR